MVDLGDENALEMLPGHGRGTWQFLDEDLIGWLITENLFKEAHTFFERTLKEPVEGEGNFEDII